jgi:hypothetical protein
MMLDRLIILLFSQRKRADLVWSLKRTLMQWFFEEEIRQLAEIVDAEDKEGFENVVMRLKKKLGRRFQYLESDVVGLRTHLSFMTEDLE